MGKITLRMILPQAVLDDLIPAFEASTGAGAIIADEHGNVYYGKIDADLPCCALAPIHANHEHIGQVALYADTAHEMMPPAAEFLARSLSHLATEIWRRQQLSDEVLARYDELNLIYELGTSFIQGVSREQIFAHVLLETNRIVQADAGVIYSWNAQQNSMAPVSHFGDQFDASFWNGRVHELALSTLYAYEEAQLFDSEKVICAPLRYNDQLLGALVLLHEAEDKTFKANELNLLTTLTQNTSLFIYAIELMAELSERNTQLENALKDLQAARDKLHRTERLSIIGQTVGSLVHDMRNPLSNVMGYAGMLQDEYVSYEDRRMFAGQIVKYAHEFSDMAQEILDYIQGDETLRKAPTLVDIIMQEVWDKLMPPGLEQPIRITLNYDSARGYKINVDRFRFVRVFQNLVNNSIDAIENSGGSQVEIAAEADTDGIRFTITDDGPGIPEQIINTIFEPGFTHGKARGTGLGLAIVQRMVAFHGGQISYQAAPGGGARFIFTVPITHDDS